MSKLFDQIVIATDTFGNWLSLTNQMANAYKNVVTTAANSSGDLTNTGNGFVVGAFGGNTIVVYNSLRGGNVESSANLSITSNVVVGGANTTFNANVLVNSSNLTVNANTFAVFGVAGGNTVTITSTATTTNVVMLSNNFSVRGNTTVVNVASFSNSVSVTGPVTLSNTMSFPDSTMGSNSLTTASAADFLVDSFDKTVFRGGKYVISVKDNANSTYQLTEILLMHDGDVTSYVTEYATLRSTSNNLAVFVSNVSGTSIRLYSQPSVGSSSYKISRNLIKV